MKKRKETIPHQRAGNGEGDSGSSYNKCVLCLEASVRTEHLWAIPISFLFSPSSIRKGLPIEKGGIHIPTTG